MQGETVTRRGTMVEDFQRYDWKYNSSTYTWYLAGTSTQTTIANDRYSFRKVLTSDVIRRGDKRTPNPWSYSKEVQFAPHGTWTKLTAATFPQRHIIRTDVRGYVASDANFQSSYPTSIGPYALSLDNYPLNARQKCLQKLWDAVKDSEVNLGTTVGEGRESITMLRDIAKRALKIKSQLLEAAVAQKGKRRALQRGSARVIVQKAPDTVAGLWLGWSVGLAPLINDCDNIRNHSWASNPLVFDVKARASDKVAIPYKLGAVTERCSVSERVQMGMRLKVVDWEAFEVYRSGLVLRPTLAWELVTLSFVVDYFVQVGGYLQCLESSLANNGFEFVSGYESTTRKVEQEYKKDQYPGPSINYTSVVEQQWGTITKSRELVTFQRKLMTRLPLPHRPVVKLPSASTALLNCAALLQLLFLSKR